VLYDFLLIEVLVQGACCGVVGLWAAKDVGPAFLTAVCSVGNNVKTLHTTGWYVHGMLTKEKLSISTAQKIEQRILYPCKTVIDQIELIRQFFAIEGPAGIRVIRDAHSTSVASLGPCGGPAARGFEFGVQQESARDSAARAPVVQQLPSPGP
jgi:hypothetical protein